MVTLSILFIISVVALVIVAFFFVTFVWQKQQRVANRRLYQLEIDRGALTQHLERVVKYASDIIILTDQNLRILEANDRALAAYGYTLEEIRKLSLTSLIAPEGLPAYQAWLQRVSADGALLDESKHRRRDGSSFSVEVSATRIYTEDKAHLHLIIRDVTERKRIDDEIQRSRALLSSVVDGTSDAIYVKDTDGRYQLFNTAAARFTEQDAKNVIGHDDTFLFPADEAKWVMERDKQVMFGGKTVSYEETVTTATGKKTTFLSTKGPVLDAAGRLVGLFGVAHDVTERMIMQEQLLLSEKRYRSIFESAAVSLWEVDLSRVTKYLESSYYGGVRDFRRYVAENSDVVPETMRLIKVLDVNQQSVKMFGARDKDEVMLSAKDVFRPESMSAYTDMLIAMAEEKPRFEAEAVMQTLQGERLDVLISVVFSSLSATDACSIVSITDITSVKRTEMALQDSESLLLEAQTDANIGNWHWDIEKGSLLWSAEIYHILGLEPEMVGPSFETLLERVDGRDVALFQQTLQESVASGKQHDIDLRIVRADGAVRTVAFRTKVYVDDKGVAVRMSGTIQDISDRKAAETGLLLRESQYRELAESIPEVFLAFDSELRCTYWNNAAEALLGTTSAVAVGKPLASVIPDRVELSRTERICRDVLRVRRPDRYVATLELAGTEHVLDININPSANGVSIIVYDITNKTRYEQELRRLRMAIEAADEVVFMTDPEGMITYINPQFSLLYGWPEEDVVGLVTPRILKSGRMAEEDYKVFWRAMLGKQVVTGEITNKTRDGRFVTVDSSSSPILDENGVIIGYFALQHDVTLRKEAEQALAEVHAFNSSILENAPNPIIVMNPDRSIRYVNPALEALTEYSRDELLGCSIPYPWLTDVTVEEEAWKFADLESAGVPSEQLIRSKNGELHWIRLLVYPVSQNGELQYFLGNWVDITERKQMEERYLALWVQEKTQRQELEKEARSRALFIDVLAHELRTPLSPLIVCLGMLQETTAADNNSMARKLVGNAYESAWNLARRLEDLLDIGKYSRGTFTLSRRPTDLARLLDEVISRFKPTTDQRGQRLEVIIADDMPKTEVDPGRLEQVLINLLSNASKFGSSNGSVILSARCCDDELVVEVTDDGAGISLEEQAMLFEAYHRVRQDQQKYPGTGLGLAVAKQIVEAHGGRIWVNSQFGHGSTFSFSIPLKQPVRK